ncbi:conserved hypothetical protein [Altererythrobacter sp. B11]|uniref:hypothetical protein n=1 Tax=Altererythrobacter sp. B11 TaxID=2060312 RepID=UPI000DC72010|nr:hypothetical protein [Altererythrobacter sp. B11]BBC71869.1 conserved hypothetical protein [Altererythrobacter sp. B11]
MGRGVFFERLRRPSAASRSVACNTYRLKFQSEDGLPAKDIEFEAHDAYEALTIAQREARTKSVELWREGKRLCLITRNEGSFWEISALPELPGQA